MTVVTKVYDKTRQRRCTLSLTAPLKLPKVLRLSLLSGCRLLGLNWHVLYRIDDNNLTFYSRNLTVPRFLSRLCNPVAFFSASSPGHHTLFLLLSSRPWNLISYMTRRAHLVIRSRGWCYWLSLDINPFLKSSLLYFYRGVEES